MKTAIYCKNDTHGIHTFYLFQEGRSYYLFSQHFHKSVQRHYGNGVPLQWAMDHSRANQDKFLLKTMSKLPAYIRYLEKEYDLQVLQAQTKKKMRPERTDRMDIEVLYDERCA